MKKNRPQFSATLVVMVVVWFAMVNAVHAQVFQDLFGNRQTLTTASGVLAGDNTGATIEAGEPRLAGKPGGHSLWISWLAPTNGVARFQAEGALDTLLAAYYFASTNDTTFDRLISAAGDDDSEELGDRESSIEFGVRAGHRYEIAVDGYFGAVGAFTLRWRMDATAVPPPVILATSPDKTVNIGDAVTLTVSLTNVPGGTKFRWLFNGVEIPDEKNTNLVLPSVQVTNVGRYKMSIDLGQNISFFAASTEIQINTEGANALAQSKFPDSPPTGLIGSDGNGSSLRPKAILRFSLGSVPLGGTPSGVVRGYNGSQIFNTTFATTDPAEPPHCQTVGGYSYWLMYQPPANGTITLDTVGSTYDTVMEVYTYNGVPQGYADLISVGCDHDGISGGSMVQVPLVRARPYLLAIAGVNGARGTVVLNYHLNTNQLPQPPTMPASPPLQVVTNGATVLLDPRVSGCPPLRFSWRKDNAVLLNSNMPWLFWQSVGLSNTGNYILTASNDLGGLQATLSLRVFIPTQCEMNLSNGALALKFASPAGQFYTIQGANSVTGPWLPVSAPIQGDDSTVQTNLPMSGASFFRIKID